MPSFRCPSCGKAYRWNESVAGKVVQCTSCQQMMNVPSVSAAAPSIDSASESIIAPLTSRRAGDYSRFKYAPPDPPKEPKKNVYIILDAGDAAMVASFLALGVVLFGVGWMITRQFIIARPPEAPPAIIAKEGDESAPEVDERVMAPVAKNGEKILLVGGTCRLADENKPRAGTEGGVTLEVGIDYRLVGESVGGDGLTFLVVKGDGTEGRWPLEVIETSEGHLPLAFKLTGVSRESLSTLILFVEGAGESVISNKLELKPEITDQVRED